MHNALHAEALIRAKDYTKATIRLIEILEEIDNTETYRKLGYNSLWSYMTVGLKLSESETQQFLSVMRKSKLVPELRVAIANGEISLPKAALITKEITEENQDIWLENAKTLTTRELKEELAKANPGVLPMTRITPRTENISELKLGLTKQTLEKLKEVEDILSQKKKRNVVLSESIEELCEFYLEKNCPKRKAARTLCANKVKVTPVKPGRIQLPAWIKNTVHKKYQTQCGAIQPNGQRCTCRRFLEIHHIIPISQGGKNHPDNLILLCSGHHKGKHQQTDCFKPSAFAKTGLANSTTGGAGMEAGGA